MQLRFLLVSGPIVDDAYVPFGAGLNVIYGGSNTGKSHIFKLIDYVLGAKDPPEAVPEQADYDLVRLGVEFSNGEKITLVRSLLGGDLRVLDGLVKGQVSDSDGTVLRAKHGKNSLSKYLLQKIGADGARIRTNADGKIRDLSFRDIAHNVLIEETKIHQSISPVLSGQHTQKTGESSVFKFLLTGIDDSSLDLTRPDEKKAAQLELVERHLSEVDREIESYQDLEELVKLDNDLNKKIEDLFGLREQAETIYRDLSGERRGVRERHEQALDRIYEIKTLQSRFELLNEHYASDLRRLDAISEAGTFLQLEGGVDCPICGSATSAQRPDHACEGGVAEISAAAAAEARDLKIRQIELGQTVEALSTERLRLESFSRSLTSQLNDIQRRISYEMPAIENVRAEASSYVQQKVRVNEGLALVRRRDNLLVEKAELSGEGGHDSSTLVAQRQLNGGVLDKFCRAVESELHAWEFPDADRVFFELPKMDISVSGKSRKANGKGVRALLHGAFSIALMRFCRDKERAHPGFLILDSLFVTYRDPDPDSLAIAATPLKDRALEHLAGISPDMQLIILENVEVPDWMKKDSRCIHFSGKGGAGRQGLFPA